MILSDNSDELLIKQLQLNIDEKEGGGGPSFQNSSSNAALIDQSLVVGQKLPLADKPINTASAITCPALKVTDDRDIKHPT